MALVNAILLTPKGATLPNTNFPALNKTSGTNVVYETLNFDQTTDETAYWLFPTGDTAPTSVAIDVFWTASAGSATQAAYLAIDQQSVANDAVLDTAGTQVTGNDALLATGDVHLVSITGTAAEYAANAVTHIKFTRDADNASDNLAADFLLLGIIIRLS